MLPFRYVPAGPRTPYGKFSKLSHWTLSLETSITSEYLPLPPGLPPSPGLYPEPPCPATSPRRRKESSRQVMRKQIPMRRWKQGKLKDLGRKIRPRQRRNLISREERLKIQSKADIPRCALSCRLLFWLKVNYSTLFPMPITFFLILSNLCLFVLYPVIIMIQLSRGCLQFT